MTRKIAFLALALWAVTIIAGATVFIRGSTAAGSDGRTAVLVQAGERDFVLGEMRKLLDTVATINKAVVEGDNAKVAAAAQQMGSAEMHDAPPTLLAKLPIEFKKNARALHGGFDDLAAAARRGDAPTALASQMAEQMARCSKCHQNYRFDLAK